MDSLSFKSGQEKWRPAKITEIQGCSERTSRNFGMKKTAVKSLKENPSKSAS